MTIMETRAKTTEENVKNIEAQLQSYMMESAQLFDVNETKLDDLRKKMDLLMEKLLVNTVNTAGTLACL
ncbi:hypothetical protein RND71_003075 [Anisodus tanguticus]|uniref:Uncharacterized protein n=1 Tax=Anisodus tanguticus TaxID=243964 RepID=A0AAE1VWF4_9SOLA|nr:hypothetical protein RND71_003075 [Anisodus tanguticus]